MTQITNLTRFRKQKARDAKRQQGDENAARFGLTPAERRAQAQAEKRAQTLLDQKRIVAQDDGKSGPDDT